jgi:hypothetical protein
MRQTKLLLAIFIVANFIIVPTAYAHPGRTDNNGCHTCYTNCENWGLKYGEYHCHGTDNSVKTETRTESRKTARRSSR